MIYERVPRTIKHRVILSHLGTSRGKVTVVLRSVSTSILLTCHAVHEEANSVVQKAICKFVLSSPPRLVADFVGGYEVIYDLMLGIYATERNIEWGRPVAPTIEALLSENKYPL